MKNTYDFYCCTDIAGIKEHDPALNSTNYFRGNLATSTTPSGAKTFSYDIGGNTATNQTNGVNTTITTNSTTNWAAPSQITTGTLSSNMGWNSALSLTSASGPNGDSMSINYDSSARPSYTTSPYGATTSYTYTDNPTPPTAPSKTATVMGHWAKTSMDGFGRTIKVETGTSTTTVSATDTMYAPCGCSPLAKLTAQSQPYAPGSTTRYWTVYGYDGSGRTVSVSAPDYQYTSTATPSAGNGSRTTYVYQGNTVNATDAAGKWKQFRMDAFGNLTVVIEPNPAATAGPPDPTQTPAQVQAAQNSSGVYLYFVTSYTYDFLNHLTAVSMPRPGVTNPQTRSFNYIDPATGNPGALLRTAVNPETGTVSYTYNSDMTLNTKTDNKLQVFSYQYDSLKRLTQINVGGNMLRKFSYDSNPYDGSFSSYTSGRLAAVQNAAFTPGTPNPYQVQFTDMYSYTQAGKVSKKRLQVGEAYANGYGFSTINLDASYSYDNEGKMTSVSYPSTTNGPGPTYTYGFDNMQRPNQLTDQNLSVVVNNVQYGGTNSPNPNALTAISYFGANETRTYNGMGQMTNVTVPGYINMDYAFPTVGNNAGKISSQTDHISVETITYQYDSLNRLSSAAGSGWTQNFGYDGFGSLVSKTGTNSPPLSIAVDSATNRIVGQAYDLNGNQLTANGLSGSLTYDAENRLFQANNVLYGYDNQNKRVWKGTLDGSGNMQAQEVYFYSVDGRKLGTYSLSTSLVLADAATETVVFFGSKRVAVNGAPFVPDRLGSNGKYFPYGEDRGAVLPNDQVKFATYTRDSATVLDYADQRYYASTFGRFMTPDPYKATATSPSNPKDPQSWNRYLYVEADPINANDPRGLYAPSPESPDDPDDPCDPFNPGPWCFAPPPPPKHIPKLTVKCQVQLWSQGVGNSSDPYQHTVVQVSWAAFEDGQLVYGVNVTYEGVSAHKNDPTKYNTNLACLFGGCWLNEYQDWNYTDPVAFGPGGTAYNSTPSQGMSQMTVVASTGFSTKNCAYAAAINARAAYYFYRQNNTITYQLFGTNSNSFSFTLLLSGTPPPGFFPDLNPLLYPGWGIFLLP